MKSKYIKIRLLLSCALLSLCAVSNSQEIPIGPFSSNGLVGWESKSFDELTDYLLISEESERVLKAESNGNASALIYKKRIDLQQTPWLNWRWKVDQALAEADETTKSADDYNARVYVIVDGGIFRWRSKALNYVWSSRQAPISDWPNAYLPESCMMVSVRSASDASNQWYAEKRNVFEDLQKAFGKKIQYIDAIAIMTDTDNTDQQATAWYGDIFFSTD